MDDIDIFSNEVSSIFSSSEIADYSDSEYLEFRGLEESSSSLSPELDILPPLLLNPNRSVFQVDSIPFIWCYDYATDIVDSLKEIEKNRLQITYKSPQTEYRANLVQVIKYSSEIMQLGRTTVHLAVYILDVFMDTFKILSIKLNAIALTCLLLASKIEERDDNVPRLERLSDLSGNYKSCEFKAIEIKILEFFKWYILFPTAATYLEFYVSNILSNDDFITYMEHKPKYISKSMDFSSYNEMIAATNSLVFEFLDLTLLDQRLVQVTPSVMAAACLAAARKNVGCLHIWNAEITKMTGYTFYEISEVYEALLALKRTYDHKEKIKLTPDSGFLETSDSSSDSEEDEYTTCNIPFKKPRLQ